MNWLFTMLFSSAISALRAALRQTVRDVRDATLQDVENSQARQGIIDGFELLETQLDITVSEALGIGVNHGG